jgi:hypothetical protein
MVNLCYKSSGASQLSLNDMLLMLILLLRQPVAGAATGLGSLPLIPKGSGRPDKRLGLCAACLGQLC